MNGLASLFVVLVLFRHGACELPPFMVVSKSVGIGVGTRLAQFVSRGIEFGSNSALVSGRIVNLDVLPSLAPKLEHSDAIWGNAEVASVLQRLQRNVGVIRASNLKRGFVGRLLQHSRPAALLILISVDKEEMVGKEAATSLFQWEQELYYSQSAPPVWFLPDFGAPQGAAQSHFDALMSSSSMVDISVPGRSDISKFVILEMNRCSARQNRSTAETGHMSGKRGTNSYVWVAMEYDASMPVAPGIASSWVYSASTISSVAWALEMISPGTKERIEVLMTGGAPISSFGLRSETRAWEQQYLSGRVVHGLKRREGVGRVMIHVGQLGAKTRTCPLLPPTLYVATSSQSIASSRIAGIIREVLLRVGIPVQLLLTTPPSSPTDPIFWPHEVHPICSDDHCSTLAFTITSNPNPRGWNESNDALRPRSTGNLSRVHPVLLSSPSDLASASDLDGGMVGERYANSESEELNRDSDDGETMWASPKEQQTFEKRRGVHSRNAPIWGPMEAPNDHRSLSTMLDGASLTHNPKHICINALAKHAMAVSNVLESIESSVSHERSQGAPRGQRTASEDSVAFIRAALKSLGSLSFSLPHTSEELEGLQHTYFKGEKWGARKQAPVRAAIERAVQVSHGSMLAPIRAAALVEDVMNATMCINFLHVDAKAGEAPIFSYSRHRDTANVAFSRQGPLWLDVLLLLTSLCPALILSKIPMHTP